jgi:hypothetical protein
MPEVVRLTQCERVVAVGSSVNTLRVTDTERIVAVEPSGNDLRVTSVVRVVAVEQYSPVYITQTERVVAVAPPNTLRVTSTVRVVAVPYSAASSFDCDVPSECEWEAVEQPSARFDLTAATECEWTAPQPAGAWTIDPHGDIDFTGTGSRVGRFDCAAPETQAEFTGRQQGPVILTVDQATRCSWLVGGDVVKKDCLAGDARWVGISGGGDGEENYVF